MCINIKCSIIEEDNVPKICFSREELLYIINRLDKFDDKCSCLLAFLETLDNYLTEQT